MQKKLRLRFFIISWILFLLLLIALCTGISIYMYQSAADGTRRFFLLGSDNLGRDVARRLLQGARIRFSKPEYISCPGCGRTLYNLEETIARIKAATGHLKGVKIAIMGCIVNGPGEMADADFGYVGAGRGKISLYRGKECIEKNIPEENAVERLLQLIEETTKR